MVWNVVVASLRAILSVGAVLAFSMTGWFCFIPACLWALGFRCKGVHGIEHYWSCKLSHHHPKAVIVYNHPTCFDQICVMAAVRDKVRLLFAAKYNWSVFRCMVKLLGCIPTSTSGTSRVIIDTIEKRKPQDPLLAIAPTGGYSDPEGFQHKLREFRSGAFLVPDASVLPVVVRYDPYVFWRPGEHMVSFIWRKLKAGTQRYTVRVLPPMTRDVNADEDMHAFKERVRRAMEDALAVTG